MSSDRLIALLTYIEEAEKLRSKAPFTVPTEFFAAPQHEMKGLPELRFNVQTEGDDIWLRVPRLLEITAPEPGETLRAWVTLPKSPDKTPELNRELIKLESRREVGREKLEDHPEIKEVFDWYVEHQWRPWAEAEKPRRKAISVYNRLFSVQQTISSEGAETPLELVWGIGHAVWRKSGAQRTVSYPLLLQSCDISLDERTLEILIRPRDVDTRLEVGCYAEMELSGVKYLEAFWKSFQAASTSRVNPFDASTYEGVLRAAVAHLDPQGSYEERVDDVTLPAATDKLKVTNTWVLFARKRSPDSFREDLERLKAAVAAASSIPPVLKSFVQEGDATVRVRPEVPFRGLYGSETVAGAKELYFPMPYNDEQVSIVRKLELNDGVVVQGPPGTGKTHTIANVICHFLAQGKRVLVAAKGETALSVLQEKLPERIRPLSVALLSDERDGMKQFEHAIQTIATSVGEINPDRSAKEISRRQEELDSLHARIANLDKVIGEFATRHMRRYVFQGREVTPEEMAKAVIAQADQHEWMDDNLPNPGAEGLGFAEADISSIRQARARVGSKLNYLNASIPPNDDLPSWTKLAPLHQDMVRARTIEHQVRQGGLLPLADSTFETFEKARALLAFLEERTALRSKTFDGKQWVQSLTARFFDSAAEDPALQSLLRACEAFADIASRRKTLIEQAVEIPDEAELDQDFVIAIGRCVEGKKPFPWPFGKGNARKLVDAVVVSGITPRTQDEWLAVHTYTKLQFEVRQAAARWKALCSEFSLALPAADLNQAYRMISQYQTRIFDIHKFVFDYERKLVGRVQGVFGKRVADTVVDQGEPFLDSIQKSLRAHVDRSQLAHAMNAVRQVVQKLEGRSGAIVDSIKVFLATKLGHPEHQDEALQTDWLALQADLARLNSLRSALDEIERVAALVERAGAPRWAHRMRTLPAGQESDPVVPATWLEAWNWRLACLFLDRIDEHKKLRRLAEERKALSLALARAYVELVAEKTWLGVYDNSPDSIRQALQAYLNAIQAMGTGTGIRAIRHRRNAREAMKKAYQAVPCWVLPQWRVSETIPPEIGLFDLVVIDEASQSDISALPALLRGKKLLIVGDQKQVSPSAVGIPEQHILDLEQRFLRDQPHGRYMTPDQSIYDLARVVFAGNSVMLREHFRCVPPIIEFSNREFYQGAIKPLRIPNANERLDPPLIDVLVKGGRRVGDVNKAEAKAVIDEIRQILGDPQFAGRTLGVVTLLGTAQAAHIHDLVQRYVPAAEIVGRRIAVGPPPVFQGRERDIMLVSMVLGPGDRAAQSRADQYQRFNVALSRARDRMYLFRSVEEHAFDEKTLNGKVISHFRQPFMQDARRVTSLRELCESPFEQEMFDELVQQGYRVRPQVPCGGYRIDLVVEGNEGRRLAIECDGDKYHGPEHWSDDMARQRVLERAGWTFWRCFGSSFVRRRREVLDDLSGTLAGLGIEPLGAESVDNTVWVLHKTADPYGVERDRGEDGFDEQEAA